MDIRPCELTDLVVVKEVVAAAIRELKELERPIREWIAEYLRTSERIDPEVPFLLVGEHAGNIVTVGGHDGNTLKRLYVSPDYQGMGLGSEMLAHVEQRALEGGKERLNLVTFSETVGFYEGKGYKQEGEPLRDRLPTGILLLYPMEKELR